MMLYDETFRGTAKLFLSLKATVDVQTKKIEVFESSFPLSLPHFVIKLPFFSGPAIFT